MSIIIHDYIAESKGYFSKIYDRKIVTNEQGAQSCQLWDQTIPPGGYIVAHYHEFEEVITILSGHVHLTLGGTTAVADAMTTIFIPAGVVHSFHNDDEAPVRLLAYLATDNPQVKYVDHMPQAVVW